MLSAHHTNTDMSTTKLNLVVVAAALLYGIFLWQFTSDTVGGSDSAGYYGFARMLADGEVSRPPRGLEELEVDPLARHAILIPLGWRGRSSPSRLVPVFPMGLPVQMLVAAGVLGWQTGPFVLAPLAGAVGLMLMYLLGLELGLSRGGAVAATVMLGCWPTYLFGALQPMSDTNSAVWCMAAVLLALRSDRRPGWAWLAGAAFGMAVLVRPPNVLLLPALALCLGTDRGRWLRFLVGGAPMGLFFLGFNAASYGDPLQTGNGFLMRQDFGLDRFPDNAWNYTFWVIRTLTPIIPLAWLAYLLRGEGTRRNRLLLAIWPVPLAVFYLFFKAGDAWWWTRYLLPAAPPVLLAAVLVVEGGLRRTRAWTARVAAAAALLAVLGASISLAQQVQLLTLARGEAIYRTSVEEASELMPDRAIVIASQMGTAVEVYSEHIPVRFEWLQPERFAELRRVTERKGLSWYALVYPHEEERFREHAPGEWNRAGQVRHVAIYRLPPDRDHLRAYRRDQRREQRRERRRRASRQEEPRTAGEDRRP